MTFTLRLSEEEKAIIKKAAEFYGVSMAEFVRKATLEKLEEEFDLKVYNEAKSEFEANPVTCTTQELAKELGIDL